MRAAWVVPGAICVLTLLTMAAPIEIVARLLFDQPEPGSLPCLVMDDPSTGVRAIPNSVCHEKTYESAMEEYRFNNCGHRTAGPCGPKSPGVYRIVMLGSSLAEGFTVPFDRSFAGLLPGRLTHLTGRKVEVYDEGLPYGAPHVVLLRFGQALAAQPDLILWPITPWDIEHVSLAIPSDDPQFAASAPLKKLSFWGRLELQIAKKRDLKNYRAYLMMQHFLYESDSIYLAHSLSGDDPYASSLRDHPSPDWQRKLDLYAEYLNEISARARAANVPLVLVAIPRHAQGSIIASKQTWANVNPYAFGDQMRRISAKYGATYIDILHDFRDVPSVNTLFYPVDQHLTVRGNQVVADMIAAGLSQGIIPNT